MTEKLESKALSAEQMKVAGLPKGKYFQVAEGHAAPIANMPSPAPRKKEPANYISAMVLESTT